MNWMEIFYRSGAIFTMTARYSSQATMVTTWATSERSSTNFLQKNCTQTIHSCSMQIGTYFWRILTEKHHPFLFPGLFLRLDSRLSWEDGEHQYFFRLGTQQITRNFKDRRASMNRIKQTVKFWYILIFLKNF